jgi:hypothetical protein
MPPFSPHPENFWPVIPLFFVLFFFGIWTLVCFLVSRRGWHSFSSRYPVESRPPGQAYSATRSWFGSLLGSYKNAVRIVFTDAGLYFYVLFLFRAFHPPFLVPWASVRRIEKQDGPFRQVYRMDIKDVAGEIHVLLPTTIEDDLSRYYRGV